MVLPLYDHSPFRLPHRPIVTWALIAANVLVFLIEFVVPDSDAFVLTFGAIPAAVVGESTNAGELSPVLTLITYQFLHADFMHIFGNMIFLWVFGDDVEEALGRGRFLLFYLSCGVIGALAFVASGIHAETPLIGASGSISGVVIAYLMLRPCAPVTVLTFGFLPMRLSAYWVVGFFIVLQFVNLGSASASEVAYWCHVGGMGAGALLFPLLRRPGVRLFECIRRPDELDAAKDPEIAAAAEPRAGGRRSPSGTGNDRHGPWG